MRKIGIILSLLLIIGCTNKKVVEYNEARLNNIEEYLRNNENVVPIENMEKLKEDGKIEYNQVYKSLEREAEEWKENQQK